VNKLSINRGKRAKVNGNKGKTAGIIIIILIIIIIITMFIILKSKISNQDDNKNTPMDTSGIEEPIKPIEIEIEPLPTQIQDEIVSVEDMPKKMGKYNVIGKLVIEKISLEKYILEVMTDNALDLSITKLDGTHSESPDINTVGNFCIAGHNYKKQFRRLKDLEIGDEFYLVGSDGRKVNYVIYNKFSVDPNDPNSEDCLGQETNGKREVTLVTCNPGAWTRLILKAEEKN